MKKGKEKKPMSKKKKIIIAAVIVVLLIAGIGGSGEEEKKTDPETTTEAIEASEQYSLEEPEEDPEPNTSAMVDHIAREAKKSANISATAEKRDEAISFIRDTYPDYFVDNETMEKTMYYGFYLEYAYGRNGQNLYSDLGMDAQQVVKGVYRNVDKIEDDIVQANLKQIKDSLEEIDERDRTIDALESLADMPSDYVSALAQAGNYSDTLHMSKQGIYDQLTSEYGGKFTADAAQYAIDNLSADYNLNALKSAEGYSETMHMSKQAIYDQLTSEYGGQFTAEEAQYAVDNLVADYKQNALKSAKSYQETLNMSTAAIYDQLVSEYGGQFTPEEAQYAVENLN